MQQVRCFFIALTTFLLSISAFSQTRQPAFEMNEKLGRGINMGNTFEAPSETAWGNPWDPEYFKIIAELGFGHIRLPVRWEPSARSMLTPPYTIQQSFLERIQQVVDTAINNGLYIIVNMHHHDSLYEHPDEQKDRFLSQWGQIADYFKDYPENLLFEVLNEPHGNLTPELWNQYFAEALAEIRQTNPTRVVLMGVAEFGGLGGIAHLDLPDDEYIILSPHYYNPFNFTHQGAEWVGEQSNEWLGTEWLDTEADRETVMSEFNFAIQFSEENNIPIHVGEFGAYSKADIESRERWTTFLARWFEGQGFSWAYWEFSAGFGIYDPDTEELLTSLVDALLHNEMPESTPVYFVPIYESDFSGGADGWALTTQGGASGGINTSNSQLTVTLTNGGTEAWHAQLVKNNILLEKDKLYRISFKAQAEATRSATFYAGKASDPWNAYSGYSGVSVGTEEQSFFSSFTMANPTDPAARLVFDLGTSATGITISEVKVEEIQFAITGTQDEIFQSEVQFYPNPVSLSLHFRNSDRYHLAELFDMQGRKIASFDLHPLSSSINLEKLPQGIYLIQLSGNDITLVKKIVKE